LTTLTGLLSGTALLFGVFVVTAWKSGLPMEEVEDN